MHYLSKLLVLYHYAFHWAFQVSFLQQGISALAQHILHSPLPPFLLIFYLFSLSSSLSLSVAPPLHVQTRQHAICVCVCMCVCMRRVDGDAACWSWELQGDWGNGEGYRALTTVTMQCPLPEHLLIFTSLHLSVFPLPLSLYRLRWTACPCCSASFSAATTSPGKSLYRLTPSSPQDRNRDGGRTVPRPLPWLWAENTHPQPDTLTDLL